MENQVSMEITPLIQADVIAKLNDVIGLLPDLFSLTADQRREVLKMGDKSTAFVSHTFAHAEQHGEFCPSYLDMVEFKKDVDLDKVIYSIKTVVEAFLSNLEDTRMIAGSEGFYEALAYYNSVKEAAKNNVPNAKAIYDDLKARFPGRGPAKPATPSTI